MNQLRYRYEKIVQRGPELCLNSLSNHFHTLQMNSPGTFRLRLAGSDISADICTWTAAAEPCRESSPHRLEHASAARSITSLNVRKFWHLRKKQNSYKITTYAMLGHSIQSTFM